MRITGIAITIAAADKGPHKMPYWFEKYAANTVNGIVDSLGASKRGIKNSHQQNKNAKVAAVASPVIDCGKTIR